MTEQDNTAEVIASLRTVERAKAYLNPNSPASEPAGGSQRDASAPAALSGVSSLETDLAGGEATPSALSPADFSGETNTNGGFGARTA